LRFGRTIRSRWRLCRTIRRYRWIRTISLRPIIRRRFRTVIRRRWITRGRAVRLRGICARTLVCGRWSSRSICRLIARRPAGLSPWFRRGGSSGFSRRCLLHLRTRSR
jgi:hypothetical protein